MDCNQLPTILDAIEIKLVFQDLVNQFPEASRSESVLKQAAIIFDQERYKQKGNAVFSIMRVAKITVNEAHLFLPDNDTIIRLNLGHSTKFLGNAELVVTGVYTSDNILKEKAQQASLEKRYLDSYIFEQLAMVVLGKIGASVNSIIEKEAQKCAMGVGPLLSPGSVHGWEISDQEILCSLLPLRKIGLRCLDNGVLEPFNSLSFLIGIGPGYTKNTVGSPCEVCSRRERCEMRETL